MLRKRVTTILKSSSLGRAVMRPLRWLYRLYAVPMRRRLLKLRGPAVLADLANIFARHGIKGFAAFGTLLGIVREKGFIAHDEDIDLGILPGSITPQRLLDILLKEETGFSLAFAFSYHGRITEFKVYYKGIPIDFFFFEDVGDRFRYEAFSWQEGIAYPSEFANSVRLVYQPAVRELKTTHVFGVAFPIPVNEEEVLVGLYGKTWRVPNVKWSEDDRPKYEQMQDFGYSVSLEGVYRQS